MKKALKFCVVFLTGILMPVTTVATSAFGQTPQREVVFTLNANEVIYKNEYALFQTLNQNRFACITHDTITNKYTFVFNGQRIKTVSEIRKDYIDCIDYVNPGEAKGYAFSYKENGKWYINYHGVVDGGFENMRWEDDYDVRTSERDYDYLYKLVGSWYTSKNGKKKRANVIERIYKDGQYYVNVDGSTVGGPYDDIDDYTFTESGKYTYSYKDNDKYYVNINGSIVGGPYDDIDDYTFTESGKYAYSYKDNDEYYVNINGSIVGEPYDYIHYLTFTESGKYAYRYADNGKYYVNINGSIVGRLSDDYNPYIGYIRLTESGKYAYEYEDNDKYYVNINGSIVGGPYDDIDYLTLTESGKYAYRYKENDNDKWYVNVNGSTVGGSYDEYIYDLRLTESGKYAYKYKDNGKWYANINGSTVGPYDYIGDLTLTEGGKYSYDFRKDRKNYINTNGVVTVDKAYRIFDTDNYEKALDLLDLTSKDGKHSFYSSYKYEYVVIDGRPYGKSPAINGWYNESKNAFIWNAVEGRELVVYEYKLQ
jgi:hypothetical protein